MDIDCIPNMTGLEIEHLIDDAPAGSKTEWIDINKIDYKVVQSIDGGILSKIVNLVVIFKF